MKRIAILLFFISVVFSPAFAAIGDTPEQCLERYGKFIKTCPDGSNVYKSKELGLKLVAWFENGRVNKIMYEKISGSDGLDPGFSDNEVKHLFEINGG